MSYVFSEFYTVAVDDVICALDNDSFYMIGCG